MTEPKTVKNRCHVESRDVVATETDRLVALGATVIRPLAEEYGVYWSALQDPEGNELRLGAPDRHSVPTPSISPPPTRSAPS